MLSTTKSSIKKDFTSLNIAIVGHPKVGKSTFASQLGEPQSVYFAATEKGHDFLEIFKSDISKWSDFAEVVNDLLTTKHTYKHLVIDITDKLFEYAHDEILLRNKVKSMADIPMGAGWAMMRKLVMHEVDKLNKKGIGVTFVTHEKSKEIKKDNISWTAACTSLSDTIEKEVLGACDLILFCHIDKNNKNMIRTKPTKYVQAAGDRSGKLPELMPMDAKLLMESLAK